MPRRPQTEDQLRKHLAEQLEFLRTSCELFDEGRRFEAKRLATTLRVLVHNTDRSHGLLAQLGLIPDVEFLSTALPASPGNSGSEHPIVIVRFGDTVEYVPPLDKLAIRSDWVDFSTWWTREPVLVAGVSETREERAIYTRKDLVLNVANTDGGAHVDPALEEDYVRLSRDNAIGFVVHYGNSDAVPLGDPVPPAVRQIAHEVLKSSEILQT